MKNNIKNNIESPEQLEKLYRSNKKSFKKAFFDVYDEISDYKISYFWKIRLEFKKLTENENISNIKKINILYLIIICIITGFLIKIPQIFDIDLKDFFFYRKNIASIIFLGLSSYFYSTKNFFNAKQFLISIFLFLISVIYINYLPSDNSSNSIDLVYIHFPLLMWSLYGLIFIGFDKKNQMKRIDYIKYNGDLVILISIILTAGSALTGITFALFSTIKIDISKFYFDYIVIFGLVSSPIVASYIILNYKSVINKIAPIIAKIFSPLVLITLVIYLINMLLTDRNPYEDRDFLIIFNIMLLGVMGIIIFSISERSTNNKQKFSEIILFMLSIVSIIINLIALSAILYRMEKFGFTPNRVAVLGSNILIFGNLILIMIDLFKVNFKDQKIKNLEINLAKYLPIYTIWTIFVIFILPFLFNFK